MFLKITDISLYMNGQLTRYVYTSCQLELFLSQIYVLVFYLIAIDVV